MFILTVSREVIGLFVLFQQIISKKEMQKRDIEAISTKALQPVKAPGLVSQQKILNFRIKCFE